MYYEDLFIIENKLEWYIVFFLLFVFLMFLLYNIFVIVKLK